MNSRRINTKSANSHSPPSPRSSKDRDKDDTLLTVLLDPDKGDTALPSLNVKLSGVTLTAILFQLFGGSIFGYNLGVIAGALEPLEETFDVDTQMQQIINASILLGAVVGSFSSGALSDMFGRRKCAIGFSILSLGGVIFLSFGWSVWSIIIARFILGLAIGGYSFICPLYASEISPPNIRGILTSCLQLAVTFSAFTGYLMNLAFVDFDEGWRYMFAMGGVPCVLIFFLIILRMKESPRWLVLNGREDEARPTLIEIFGEKGVDDAIETILDSKEIANDENEGGWGDVFSMKLWRHLTIGLVLAVANQFTGNNAVTFYAPKIFKEAGWDSSTVTVALTAGIGFWKFLSMSMVVFFKLPERYGRRTLALLDITVSALRRPFSLDGKASGKLSQRNSLHDRFGRRTMVLIGLTVMGSGALALGVSFFLLGDEALSIVAIFTMAIFCMGFQMGPGPLFYVVISEIYPDSIRGRAMSFVNAVQWACNLTLSLFFVTVMEAIGGGPSFMIFTGVCFACFTILFVLCPETKGKTLDEIQAIMVKGR